MQYIKVNEYYLLVYNSFVQLTVAVQLLKPGVVMMKLGVGVPCHNILSPLPLNQFVASL